MEHLLHGAHRRMSEIIMMKNRKETGRRDMPVRSKHLRHGIYAALCCFSGRDTHTWTRSGDKRLSLSLVHFLSFSLLIVKKLTSSHLPHSVPSLFLSLSLHAVSSPGRTSFPARIRVDALDTIRHLLVSQRRDALAVCSRVYLLISERDLRFDEKGSREMPERKRHVNNKYKM
jgi:hypothetical protein